MTIKGLHNIYNGMQACLAAMKAGASAENIKRAVGTFKNAAHRLEPVRQFEGVEYINDSKATNVDSAWYALECQTKPVVWIAGGTDKGNDYAVLKPFAKEKVKALVCLGLDNEKLKASFADVVPTIVETKSMEACVAECRRLATSGDVVLLSPCCASFDLFNSYIHRGNMFKEAVNALK
jgi:UDP-N-acetylmuramoylalanine--D-glutamate ligase